MTRDGFKVRLQSKERTELEFTGIIDNMAFDDDDAYVKPQSVIAFLKKMEKGTELVLYMNSPGGNASDGIQIANRLKRMRSEGHISRLETVNEGVVASAATFPFLLGDDRRMASGAKLMIHDPYMSAYGTFTIKELGVAMESLKKTRDQAAEMYSDVTSVNKDDVLEMMAQETWMTGNEAIEHGFATEVDESFAIAACYVSKSMRERFKAMPDDLLLVDPAEERKEQDAKISAKAKELHPAGW